MAAEIGWFGRLYSWLAFQNLLTSWGLLSFRLMSEYLLVNTKL
jgi:hypothetical protein